jgi:UDP-glucose 4-epimerase
MGIDCLVIGGSGFIGHSLVRQLVAAGHKVTVLGRRPASTVSLPEGCSYSQGDYGNTKDLAKHLQPGIAVFCLAYATIPSTSYEDPVGDIMDNIPPAVRFLETLHQIGAGKVLICSSGGAAYGHAADTIKESHPTRPISPYGITKCAIEMYAHFYHVTKRLPVVIARPSNAYGEGQRHGTGQGFLAEAIHLILAGKAIPIFGDGETIRDYIHVEDVARGLMAALLHGTIGEIYNVGSGQGTATYELIHLLTTLADQRGIPVATAQYPRREFDVSANVLDSSKLKHASGWSPEIALGEGVERMWLHSLARQKPLATR